MLSKSVRKIKTKFCMILLYRWQAAASLLLLLLLQRWARSTAFNATSLWPQLYRSQFALLRTKLLERVADHIEEVAHPLREEASEFKLLLVLATESMERANLFACCEASEQE
jgi:hypothetical protein